MKHPQSSTPQVPSTKVICVGATQKKHSRFILKQKLLLTYLAVIFSFIANAQTGSHCHTAQDIIIGNNSAYFYSVNPSVQTQTSNTNYWYSFNTNEATKIIKVVNQVASPLATDLKVYSGNCGNRTLIASASIASTSSISTSGFVDSMQVTVSGLTLGDKYFIEVSGTAAGAKNYGLSINSVSTVTCSYSFFTPCLSGTVSPNGCEMVINGDFQQHTANQYSQGFGQTAYPYISLACGWFSPGANSSSYQYVGTPDYYIENPNGYNSGVEQLGDSPPNCLFDTDVPCNDFNYSWGHDPTGTNNSATFQGSTAYAGFYSLERFQFSHQGGDGSTVNDSLYTYSEYIGSTLRAPMVCGVTYKGSYWVQKAAFCTQSTNNLGMMFSTTNNITPHVTPTGTSQYCHYSTWLTANGSTSWLATPTSNAVVTTHGSWVQLNFTYTARGGESYIYLGNFNALSATIVNTGTLTPSNAVTTNCHSASSASSSLSYYIIDDVSLQPMPSTLSISGSPTTAICSGSSEVLTASGGFATSPTSTCSGSAVQYTWNTGQTGSTVTENPSTSTAGTAIGYTVTSSIAGLPSCTYSASTTVTVNPTPDCPSINSSICSNQTQTITVSNAQSGVNYNWFPATGITYVPNTPHGSQVIITNPAAGTVYSVTAIYAGCGVAPRITPSSTCCTCTSTFTVSPSPTVSISENPNPANFCPNDAGSAIDLSSTSSINVFNWSPSTGLNCTTCSNPVANPNATTTYTLTSTDPTSGCSAQAYVTVNVLCSCGNGTTPTYTGNPAIYAASPSPFTAAEYGINYNINFGGGSGGTITLTNKTFDMAPNVSITVDLGTTLILDHCHLLACSDMWQGIIVATGAKLIIKNNSMIEDAIEAVNCSSWFQASPTNNSLAVDGCVFNRNRTGISINNYNYATAFPATIQNAVFTSRHLPATVTPNSWNSPATPGALKTLVAVPILQAPYKLANTASYTFANLKSPNQGIHSVNGVYLNNVGTSNTNGANSLPTAYNDITIGVTTATPNNINLNLFDGLYYGIYALNSNFTSMNNSFELLSAYPFNPICFKCPPPTNPFPNSGTAIYGRNTLLANKSYNRAQVIYPNYNPATNPNVNGINYYTPTFNNKFYDVVIAVGINNYQEVHVAGTDIRSKQINTGFVNIFAPAPGTDGIVVASSTYKYNYLRYNLITNINSAIVFQANSVVAGVTSLGFGGVNADYNNVTAFFNNNPTTEYVKRAITLDNTINCYGNNNCISNPFFSVTANNNNIQNVYSGIEMSDWFSPVRKFLTMRVFADNNYISTIQDPSPNAFTQYGINANNCYSHSISNNNINGFGITNFNVRGVFSVDNQISKVYCNNVTNITKGFEFEGLSTGFANDATTWQNNTMNTNAQGFALTNACILGQQGSPASASDNQWTGTWTGNNFGTYVDASSNAVNSPIYVQANNSANSSIYYPQNSSSAFSGVTDYVTLTNSALFFNATPSGNICATSPQPPCINCRVSNLRLAEKLVQDSIPFIILPTQSTLRGQLKYYRLLLANDSLADTSVVLKNFAIANQNTNLGTITNIESNLAQGNVSTAQALNNALVPTSTIESNYKNFYNAAINYALQPDSLLDSTVVYTLANSCPAINGDVVYAARALYNAVNQTNIYFESHCPYDSLTQTPAAGARRANQTAGISNVATTKTILVYPNPSSGDIFISGSDLTDKQWNVEITDVTGRVVLQNTYQVNQGLIKLNTQLTNGVYLVKVITANGQVQQQKVIISK